PQASTPKDKDAALLDPLFPPKDKDTRQTDKAKADPEELLVVQLVPLDKEQRRILAKAFGIQDPELFVREIEKNGLDELAGRPGDMLDLAEYWKDHRHFGSLVEMVEYAITRKLEERDKYRPDNEALSPQKARQGAERLAAALTLGKSFTLLASGHEPDPTLATRAMDPAELLPHWTDAERGALLRRGIFAPSTYGRIRFHHRNTQEYLTARWLHGLLKKGCPREQVWNLILAERYGVETLVLSLCPTAAWLALWHPELRDEIIRREPLVLLQNGDPGSLPLVAKENLLRRYAEQDKVGEIGNDHVDHRALWLFADPSLADAIRACWETNDRRDFQITLLGIVREGKIRDCVDLARDTVFDETGHVYLRIVALDAMNACDDAEGLTAVARWLVDTTDSVEVRLVSYFTKVLYPRHLTVDQLLDLLDRYPLTEEDSFISISETLVECWDASTESDRERLMAGLAELCLAPPLVADHYPVSAQHYTLAKKLKPLGVKAVSALTDAEPSAGLIRLLMLIERAESDGCARDEGTSLSDLVSRNPRLNRALMWADVAAARLEGV
ncbi:MAG: hypothetical protein KJO08_02225, partial [Gammaproteobacteria bacterium]|nr:hypothetical protein [Gammaproteobacteria bacterium]NNJ84933.1 hypothetical protein [Gammaproteobacteria bacterium]